MLKTSGSNITDLGTTKGVHTDGFNTISHRRRSQYVNNEGVGLFKSASPDDVFDTFPKDIQQRLTQMRNEFNSGK
jgi:hypothetical protein